LRLKNHIEVLTSDSLWGEWPGLLARKQLNLYSKRTLKIGIESMFGDKGEIFSFLSTFGDTIFFTKCSRNIEGMT
jgi:hypothetical protein